MKLEFTKMQGCGNDYIYVDCFRQELPSPEKAAITLSDRHFGVGGDGLVLICPSGHAGAEMRMFNLDGSESGMCGNAIRCVGKYLHDEHGLDKEDLTIATRSGDKHLHLFNREGKTRRVQVDMGAPVLTPSAVPVALQGDQIVSRKAAIGGADYEITCVSIGNPHCVVFCEDVAGLPLTELGPKFEHAPIFPDRVNTEFVKVVDGQTLQMRVWERGSGETLACGTGACASVTAAVLNGFCRAGQPVTVHLLGGELEICYTGETVLMTGNAEKVFDGIIEL